MACFWSKKENRAYRSQIRCPLTGGPAQIATGRARRFYYRYKTDKEARPPSLCLTKGGALIPGRGCLTRHGGRRNCNQAGDTDRGSPVSPTGAQNRRAVLSRSLSQIKARSDQGALRSSKFGHQTKVSGCSARPDLEDSASKESGVRSNEGLRFPFQWPSGLRRTSPIGERRFGDLLGAEQDEESAEAASFRTGTGIFLR